MNDRTMPVLRAQQNVLVGNPSPFNFKNSGDTQRQQSVEFLRHLDPTGWHNLVALDPKRPDWCEGRTFSPASWDAISKWLDARRDHLNLYYSVNEPRANSAHKKLGKDDIASARAVHLDIDPEKGLIGNELKEDRERIRSRIRGDMESHPENFPSVVVDSGNGFQIIWKLEEKLSAREFGATVEAQNRAMVARFDGDRNSTDLSRILRLPGSTNFPTPSKKGRDRVAATIVDLTDNSVRLDELADWVPPSASRTPLAGNKTPLVGLDSLAAIERAIEWLTERAPEAVEGAGGDNTTIRVANYLGDIGLSEKMAGDLMLDHWNDTKAQPPWDADELAQKVRNAFRSRQNAIGIASAEAEFDAVQIDAKQPPKRKGLNLHNITSFKWSTDHKYLVQGLLNNGMLAMMSGPSNAGKSPLALDLAAHIATGRTWQGRKVKQGYVLHYSTEGFTGLGNRMEALRREHFADGGVVPLDFVSGSLDLRTSTNDTKAIIEAVNARAAEFRVQPGLVVIDTLSHALGGGDESNPEHVRAVLRNCATITAQTGAVILLLHHPTKDASSVFRGSSILLNDIDLLVTVETDKRTKLRTVKTPRVKEFAEIKALAFRIKVIELGNDAEGDAITSVVVDWVNSAESEFESKLTPVQEDAMAAFDEALVAKGAAAGSIGLSVGFNEWSRLLRKRLGIEGNSNSSLNYARKALIDNGIIEKTKAGYIRLASG